MRPIVLGVTYF